MAAKKTPKKKAPLRKAPIKKKPNLDDARAALQKQEREAQQLRCEMFNRELEALQRKHRIVVNAIVTNNVMTGRRQVTLEPVPDEIAAQFNR